MNYIKYYEHRNENLHNLIEYYKKDPIKIKFKRKRIILKRW